MQGTRSLPFHEFLTPPTSNQLVALHVCVCVCVCVCVNVKQTNKQTNEQPIKQTGRSKVCVYVSVREGVCVVERERNLCPDQIWTDRTRAAPTPPPPEEGQTIHTHRDTQAQRQTTHTNTHTHARQTTRTHRYRESTGNLIESQQGSQ
jgi:hypothetical protein